MSGLQGPSLQGPGSQNSPDAYAGLASAIRSLSDRLAQIERGAPLRAAGISVAPEGMTINSNLDIQGALTLKPGIIGNDALANPLDADANSASQAGTAIGTASTVRATVTFTVPPGYTRALIISTAGVMGRNSTASTDYLYVMSIVGGSLGGELYTAIPAGYSGGTSAPFYSRLTALSGGMVLEVSVATRTGFAGWAASTANMATIHAQVIYLR